MSQRPAWNGEDIGQMTINHLVEVLATIQTQEEADAMLEQLCRLKPLPIKSIKNNIGYLTGYMNDEDGERIMRLFDAPHPLLGWRRDRSAMELIAIGAARARHRGN